MTVVIPLSSKYPIKKAEVRYFKNVLAFTENNVTLWYLDKNEVRQIWDWLYSTICKDQQSFKNFEKYHLDLCAKLLKFSQRVHRTDFSELNNKDLAGLFEEFFVIHNEHIWISQLSMFWLAGILSEKAQEELGRVIKDPDELAESIRIVLTPGRRSLIAKEYLDLLRLAADYKFKKITQKETNRRLNVHTSKYQWIPIFDIITKPWSKNYFKNELQRILKNNPKEELKSIIKKFADDKKAWQKLIRIKKWNPRQKLLFRLAHLMAFYKNDRDDNRRKAYFYLLKMHKEAAKRLNLSLNELSRLTCQEIVSGLKKGLVPHAAIKDRQKFFLVRTKNQKIKVFSGSEAKKLKEKLLKEKIDKSVQQISGSIASRGKVRGVTRIVETKSDLNKIKQGDIMVATTTHPDYILAMKKCSAIITDEGNIICHAAIVSREFKIPCIVGTKIATKVLKDGDKVEVDADEGIIKKI